MSSSKNILIVDDDEATREVLTLALTDEGYGVVSAQNGRAALKLVKDNKPDLILLDMRMPVMDGWTFARELRESTGPGIPVVVCTAAVNSASRAAEIQADAYIAKPFVLSELLTLLREVLERESG